MSLKQVSFNYELSTAKSTVVLYSDCQDTCGRSFVLASPVEDLFCGDCSPAILKVKDSALVVQDCNVVAKKTIVGKIVNKVRLVDGNGCPLPSYKITFEYDDTQLVSPDQTIALCDIESFSCFSASDEYLEALLLCAATLDITVTTSDPCPSAYFVEEEP